MTSADPRGLPAESPQARPRKTLRRLATAHRVYGCLLGGFNIFLMCMLWLSLRDGQTDSGIALAGVLVPTVAIHVGLVVAIWLYVALLLWAGECLANTRHYGQCVVLACLNCLYLPVGTLLGVWLLCLLPRRRYRGLFRSAPPAGAEWMCGMTCRQ